MIINIYTDGAASGNPGPGGYGIVLESGKHYKELSDGFRMTTNNRMELLATIKAMQAIKIKNAEVHIYSDSKYVVDAVAKGWVFGWEKKGFKDKKNQDMWVEFLKQYRIHTPKLHWIKGHNNHLQNERCDRLAVEASKKPNLKVDQWFEEQQKGGATIFT